MCSFFFFSFSSIGSPIRAQNPRLVVDDEDGSATRFAHLHKHLGSRCNVEGNLEQENGPSHSPVRARARCSRHRLCSSAWVHPMQLAWRTLSARGRRLFVGSTRLNLDYSPTQRPILLRSLRKRLWNMAGSNWFSYYVYSIFNASISYSIIF